MTDHPTTQPACQGVGLPLSWLWDARPLEVNSWGNVLGFNEDASDGRTILIRKWIPPTSLIANPLPKFRPANAPLPLFYADGGTRLFYVPTAADVEIVKRNFPSAPNPRNPNWHAISAHLVAIRHRKSDLLLLSPPELLALLDAAPTPPADARPTDDPATDRAAGGPAAAAGQPAPATPAAPAVAQPADSDSSAKRRLLSFLSKGEGVEAVDRVVGVLESDATVEAKLQALHKAMPGRVLRASLRELSWLLGCSPSALRKTSVWREILSRRERD